LGVPVALVAAEATVADRYENGAQVPLFAALLFRPVQAMLDATGIAAHAEGDTLQVASADGEFTIGSKALVGAWVVSMAVYAALVAHIVGQRASAGRMLLLAALGLVGLWLANLGRLALLAGLAVQPTAWIRDLAGPAGWLAFAGLVLAYWAFIIVPAGRRRRTRRRTGARPRRVAGGR
jgi:hypothetical protein